MSALARRTVARVRQQANVGVIADALADESFCRHVVKAIGERPQPADRARARSRFTPTSAYAEIACDELATLPVGPLASAEHQHLGADRRSAVPQVSTGGCGRECTRARDRALPHRGGAFPALRAARRSGGVRRGGRGAVDCGAAAGATCRTRATAGLHARAIWSASSRRRARMSRTARYLSAHTDARDAHRRAAPRARRAERATRRSSPSRSRRRTWPHGSRECARRRMPRFARLDKVPSRPALPQRARANRHLPGAVQAGASRRGTTATITSGRC